MAENQSNASEIQELNDARNVARELDPKILARIKEKQKAGPLPDIRKQFDAILARYEKTILEGADAPSAEEAVNLFQLVGAMKLVRANSVSRLVSTHLGAAWEEMAALSHLAVSPDVDFGVRLKGVDIVFLEDGFLRHTQIKTQRNTLTGSQKGRSISELQLHPRPLFAAAFDVANWTFPPKSVSGIDRLAGDEFWAKLGIKYTDVVGAARDCFINLEKVLFT
jgi:hypothetical protein